MGGQVLRRPFEQQQRRLQDKVLVLGSQTEELLRDSVAALVRQGDADRAIFLLKTGRQLIKNCVGTETDTLALLATQQPMAGDLRYLAAVFQISLELGRIANHAGEITKISLKLGRSRHPDVLLHLNHLAEATLKMFHHALGAFAERDAILARAIAVQDDEIDQLYSYINQHLRAIGLMAPHLVDQTLFISQAAHELERVGDRSTNICEWVLYAVTGELVETNIEAYERTH
jgi:phosphate transport system protein